MNAVSEPSKPSKVPGETAANKRPGKVPVEKITKRFVERQTVQGEWRDSELPGFRFKVTPTGKKVYFVQTSVRGESSSVTVTIGTHRDADGAGLGADAARQRAKEILSLMERGINPNKQKKEQAEAESRQKAIQDARDKARSVTLREVLERYLDSRRLKDSTAESYRKVVGRCLHDWLDVPIVSITKEMVEKRHKDLSSLKKRAHKPAEWDGGAQANQVMRVLRALFNYAEATFDGPDGDSIIKMNPVKRLSQVRSWNRVERRQDVIKSYELEKWYRAVTRLSNRTVRDLLLLLLFTGLRKNEASELRWSNVDFKAGLIKVEDTKNHQDHVLPMTPYIHDLLLERWQRRGEEPTEARRRSEYVFPGDGAEGYIIEARKQMAHVTQASGVKFTLHDLRRTFATIAEQLDIEGYTLKKLLNHRTGADVTAGYIIADAERLRGPMEKISAFLIAKCSAQAAPEQAPPVAPLAIAQ